MFIICSSFNVEKSKTIDNPINEKIKFFIMKRWGLIPILFATTGLANAVNILPIANVTIIRNNITLSIENHHLLIKFIFVLLNIL